MKTAFLKDGNQFRPVDPQSLVMLDVLPVGTYNVGFNPEIGFFLTKIEDFVLPSKTYGKTETHSERIFNTFKERAASTGVMLAGEKGSGKTMLAKKLALRAAAENMPTIVVNDPFLGDGFNRFIQGISQPTVILFDEFEKVYTSEQQSKMLTLLDGTFNSKKLFVLTCNDKWRIDSHMRNRPGRIFYSLEFRGLEESFIYEYCRDNLHKQEHAAGVAVVGKLFGEFNFDMLKALVEEMNRYKETAQDAARMLNLKPECEEGGSFVVSVAYRGNLLPTPTNPIFSGHPMAIRQGWSNYVSIKDEDASTLAEGLPRDSDGDFLFSTNEEMFESYDPESGTYVFGMPGQPEVKITLRRKERKKTRTVYDAY